MIEFPIRPSLSSRSPVRDVFGHVCCLLLASAGLLCAPLAAQAVADRTMLAAWDDSLQLAAIPTRLDELASESHAVGGRTGDLRRALFLIRRGELGDRRADVELALSIATLVRNHTRGWGWASFALARAFTVMARGAWIEVASDGVKPGEKYRDALWRTLRESLDLDHELTAARELLVSLSIPGGDRTLRDDQAAAFSREVARPHPDAGALVVWARHLRTTGAFDSALVYFARAEAAGADRSVIALERARTERAVGDTAGATRSYWAGLRPLSAAGRELYRFDLAWIISSDSLAAFDRLADTAVTPWLHRFWDERDATATNTPGARLLAHLMRWVVADTRYRVIAPWRYTPFDRVELGFEGLPRMGCTGSDSPFYQLLARMPPVHPGDIRHREPLLDHRGLIYLRHGTPLRIIGSDANARDAVRPPIHARPDEQFEPIAADSPDDAIRAWYSGMVGVSMRHSESWLYLIDGQLRLLHFRGSSALGIYGPTTLTGYLPAPGAWMSLGILAVYANAAQEIVENDRAYQPWDCLARVRTAIAQSRNDSHEGTRTDTDSPPILHPWQSVVQAFALGSGAERDGEALVTLAFGAAALKADTLPDGRFSYPLRLRMVAYNPATDETITRDTSRIFVRASAIPAGASLTAWQVVPLGTGGWQIAVRARQADDSSGVYTVLRNLQVDDGERLALSDIVTGIAGAPAWIATDGNEFPVNYLNGWYRGEAAEIFYEVRGLQAGEAYHTTIEVRPLDPKTRASVQIRSSDVASGTVIRARRTLGLERLSPGQYRLSVAVAAGNLRATRDRIINIVEKR